MGALESLQKIADKKIREIRDIEIHLHELQRRMDMAQSYLQAIQDSIKALPKESSSTVAQEISSALRAGSIVARTRDAIQEKGEPMHITDILAALGIENTKNSRVSLVGSLGGYVRKGVVFNRPAPNTFGLLGMEMPTAQSNENLPDGFGGIAEGD